MDQANHDARRKAKLRVLLPMNAVIFVAIGWQVARWNVPYEDTPPRPDDAIFAAAVRGPQVGDDAANFSLPAHDGAGEVTLSRFRNQKPVVLIFGSYSCPPFRGHIPALNQAYRQYKNQAEFYFVYIREAHPDDEGRIPENAKLAGLVAQPQNHEERIQLAQTCAARLDVQMPVLVDDMENSTERNYRAWPEQLLIVGADGKIAYTGAGPGDFNVPAMTAALQKML
jgi:hypothetical protein